MQIYNPIKYKWERDPQGKYAYGATCVKECPEHLLKDNGACVRACPPKKKVMIHVFYISYNISSLLLVVYTSMLSFSKACREVRDP